MSTESGTHVETVSAEIRAPGDPLDDEVTPRQQALIEDYVSIAEEHGPFDTSMGPDGAHYAPADANPFKAEGLICANCELYQPISDTEGRCAIVEGPLTDGHIEPDAICKLWVIPETKLVQRSMPVVSEVRVIGEQDIRDNPSLVTELRQGGEFIEQRVAPLTSEVRAEQDGSWTLVGHAAVFDSQSENLGGFREVIQRGAFRKVLRQDGLDVRALFNHDQNQVLGRTTNGTLTLMEDPKGLRYEVNVADTSYGRDLRVLLERGDVTQSSFAFRVDQGGQSWTDAPDGTLIRTITNFTALLDVSPVTYPAYAATSSMALTRSTEGDHETSSNSESEQAPGGAVEQPGTQAGSQPRRADEDGTHLHRARRLKLRDKRVA